MLLAAKRLSVYALCLLMAGLPVPPAWAGPSGEVVVEGDATFTRPDDQTTIIDTTTQQTVIEYDSFDILQGELVQINQPTHDSKTLNYVPFGDPTQIAGQLQSNGYVYVVNPSGVFVGDSALIDVGGLVAAAGRISYDEFMAGQDHFTELGGEVVVADGALVRADDTVALLGQRVANYGTIISEGGMVAFIAGSEAVLGSLDGRMIVRVDGGGVDGASPLPADQFALTQAGEVDAGAGRVLLTAGDTYSLAMNHTGITRGREIELHAANEGLVQVAGTLDASNRDAGESGGSIQVTGDKLALLDAKLDASGDAGGGSIRVGGDVQGGGDLRTASRTYVSHEAELRADAESSGDGGSIVVWSEEKTGFYGSASARGGSQGGDGGFVEISGRQSLDARGHHVDLSASAGENGTLLYDPDRILILGGSADGDDDPDALADNLDDGVPGRILDGDASSIDEFVIYETEIEGTDANIILQATTQIRADDTLTPFGNGDVVVMDGNSLVIQATGDGPTTPGAYAIDLLPNLTWRVSGGGVIDIRTSAGNTSDLANSSRADIRVGHLVFGGREFVTEDGLATPQLITADAELAPFGLDSNTSEDGVAVRVESEVGNIEIGSITASGSDADPVNDDGAYQLASSGGDVLVTAASGLITVGSVTSTGGDALLDSDPEGPAPSEGGLGGDVQIESRDGSVYVQGDAALGVAAVNVSGGRGLAGIITTPELDAQGEQVEVAGAGGTGGVIFLRAQSLGETTPVIVVTGDLKANGGDGFGEIGIPIGSQTLTLSGSGGTSGRIDLSSVGGVILQGADVDHRIVLEANGGTGRDLSIPGLFQTGGGASGGTTQTAISIEIPSGEGTPDGSFNVLIEHADLMANGGHATSGGAGGAGGEGGEILITAGEGKVIASNDVRIFASGGNGAAATFDGPAARPGFGGDTRVISISGNQGVEVGEIVALGGSGANADGGEGGGVELSSVLGDVRVADIDVSGGDATTSQPDQAVDGGAGGSVSLDSRTFDLDDDDETIPGGDVLIGGRVRGFGGSGVDADGLPTVAAGALLNLRSDAAIENDVASGASVEGGQVNLTAPTIGAGANGAIDIAGTADDEDSALLTTSDSLHVNLLAVHGPEDDPNDRQSGSGLEDVTVLHGVETASSQLDSGDSPILVVNGGGMAGDDVTLAHMQTADTDPTLAFELDARSGGTTGSEPKLLIEVDAVKLGLAGGSITNDDGAIVAASGATGTASHVASTGNVLLDATTIGDASEALRVDGDLQASLALRATGDVYVDVVDVAGGGAFGALDVTQHLATGETLIRGLDAADAPLGNPLLQVVDVTSEADQPLAQLSADTQSSGTSLAYRQQGAAPPGGSAPSLQVQNARLGGNGLLSVTGDLQLVDPDGASVVLTQAGADLVLDAGGDITGTGAVPHHVQLTGGAADPDDTADLVLRAGGSVGGGAADSPLLTEDVERLAAQFGDDFRLQNSSDAGLEIAQIEVLDPTDVGGDTVERTVTGILGGNDAGDDFELGNGTNRIVLGEIPVLDPAAPATHVSVAGSATFLSPVEVENAQYVRAPTAEDDDSLGSELVAVNSARIEAKAGGNILFTGAVDTGTGPGSTAVDDITDPMEGTPADPVFVPASLTVVSNGTATYQGDVGANSPFARFDTTNAVLAGGACAGAACAIHARDVIFRGTLDGPASVSVVGVETPLPAGADDPGTRVRFGGNVGNSASLASLDVQADAIEFALAGGGSAELVNVGDGGIRLDTGQTSIPAVATITDSQGNLRVQTSGNFEVGARDKLSALGNLQITAAGKVTVGDLSASRIEVQSPDIEVMTRAGALVELPDGSTTLDAGVDWVANEIVTTSAPQPAPDGFIGLYIGSGGISIPGDLGAYTVRYANPDLGSITSASLLGQDGRILDLTGAGPGVVGDPTRALPRSVDPSLPERLPVFGSDDPAGGSPVNAEQVLAFLRCSGLAPDAPGCGAGDAALLAGIGRFRDSALATDRAREITQRYRELLASPGASARLHAEFAAAGRAFGQSREWRDGSLDGAEFYRFLASARGAEAEALASVRELAWLFAEIELLGLADADTQRLQQTLAREFAEAAGLQGFDADAVNAAVDASPVGLP